MGINCRIKFTQKGDIDYIEAPNGNRSLLFDALRAILGDEKAKDYYALTETDLFKDVVKANFDLYKNKILNSLKITQPKSKNITDSVDDFKNVIQNGKWGMLTAENPDAEEQSEILNQESNERALGWLKSKGYNPISIEGKYGIKENSFFVENLSTEDAIEFAKEFKQESVATNIGLIYQDGSMNPIKRGEEAFGGKYEDFFSTININGKDLKFKIEYDFDSNVLSKIISPENSSNYANLTEDGQGNFVFYHRGGNDYKTIKKNSGSTLATSKTEGQALSKVGGLAMYYTRENDAETIVSGTSQYMVKVPIERVYDFNTDSLNLIEEARILHEKEHPNKAFDVNTQVAYITKLAAEKGYEMVVSEWGDRTRAQSTKEFTPLDVSVVDGNRVIKKFKESYKSNTEKGFEAVIPQTRGEKLQEVYEKINKERNSKSNYDTLYSLFTKSASFTQEEITDLINQSDISEELKSEYNTILTSEDETRFSKLNKEENKKFEIVRKEVNGKLIYEPTVNGKKIGGLRLEPYKDGFKIDSVTVYDKFQNKGIAKRLYYKAINDLVSQGKSIYSLKIRAPFANKIWEELVEKNIAEKVGQDFIIKPPFDNNKEPRTEVVFEYANSNEQALSKENIIEAKDTAIAFGVKTAAELDFILQQAFVKEGLIVFDKIKMSKAGFTEYEVSKILSTKGIRENIKKYLPMLKNTDFELGEYPAEREVIPNEIGLFGKQKIQNPYETEKNKLQQQQVKTIVDGEIVDKTESIKQILPKTTQLQPISAKTISFISAILNSKQNISERNQKALITIVKELKEEVIINGIDLKDIESRTANIVKLQDFVEALQTYIIDNSIFDFFTDIYDEFFELNKGIEQGIKRELTDNDVVLDTELSEYELFRDFSLIRRDKNIYTKVNDKPLEELRENYKQVFSHFNNEEIQSKVPSLEVEDFQADADIMEKMYMWKSYLGSSIKTISNAKVESISNEDFREALSNPYKKVTVNGVELIDDNPITRDNASLFEKTKEIEADNLVFDDNLEKRKQALQDKNSIAKIKTDYQYIESDILATKNNEESFVRTPNGVFERIFENGNVSFFSKVTSENKNYSNINFSNYNYLETEGNEIEAKKYYTKAEIEKINSKYFNCK